MDFAVQLAKGALGGYGIGLPEAIGYKLGVVKPILERWGVEFYLGGGERFVQMYSWTLIAALIAFLTPNTQQLMRHFEPALDYVVDLGRAAIFDWCWKPDIFWATTIAILLVASLLSLNRPSEFLYFQF